MSDLVQLLFYHAPPAPADAKDSTQPSSPLIEVSAQSSCSSQHHTGRALTCDMSAHCASSPVHAMMHLAVEDCSGIKKTACMRAWQGCMSAITRVVGSRGVLRLWVRLLECQAAEPTGLQWLPVLACWLSDSAAQSAAPSQGALPSPAASQAPLSPFAEPASPPRPALGSNGQTQGSGGQAKSHGGLVHKSQGRGGSRPQGGHAAAGEAAASPLARSVEEALQLQEAAMRIGYGAAALPLWEAFVRRYLAYQARALSCHALFGTGNLQMLLGISCHACASDLLRGPCPDRSSWSLYLRRPTSARTSHSCHSCTRAPHLCSPGPMRSWRPCPLSPSLVRMQSPLSRLHACPPAGSSYLLRA